MKHLSVSRAIVLAAASLFAVSQPALAEYSAFGFAQITVEHDNAQGGIETGADRVRVGGRVSDERFFGGLQLDLAAGDLSERKPGTLPNVIQDVYVGMHLDKQWSLKAGQFKTPLGMDFNTSGSGLHITKRGMEAGLVLQRNLGVMLSGRKLGQYFGVDAGVFNPAGRSAATAHSAAQSGEENAWAVRGLFDRDNWHAELAFGGSPAAAGPGSEDYQVMDAALRWADGPWQLQFEWIAGKEVRGERGRDERVWFAHAGYRFSPLVEGVLRHYDGESDPGGTANAVSGLSNTYIGVNLFPQTSAAIDARVQINYVFSSGDRASYSGVRGYLDDAILVQLQVAARR